MKERGIIFNPEMVRATLEDRKLQTRRVLKPQPKYATVIDMEKKGGVYVAVPYHRGPNMVWNEEPIIKCPYGEVGDRLYLREKHKFIGFTPDDGEVCIQYSDLSTYWKTCSGEFVEEKYDDEWVSMSENYEEAGVEIIDDLYSFSGNETDFPTPWRPSIFMHRWASRITLEITNIRVERVQDISEEDCKKEGVELYNNYDGTKGGWEAPDTYKKGFKLLWDLIHPELLWWKFNPWIWCIEFKRVKEK